MRCFDLGGLQQSQNILRVTRLKSSLLSCILWCRPHHNHYRGRGRQYLSSPLVHTCDFNFISICSKVLAYGENIVDIEGSIYLLKSVTDPIPLNFLNAPIPLD